MDLSDSEEEEFSKRQTGKTATAKADPFGSKKPEAKKGGVAALLDSGDSDEEDFKVGKKPVGTAAPAQPKQQKKLLMDSEDDDSEDGFKPTKKPVAEKKPVIAQAVSQK